MAKLCNFTTNEGCAAVRQLRLNWGFASHGKLTVLTAICDSATSNISMMGQVGKSAPVNTLVGDQDNDSSNCRPMQDWNAQRHKHRLKLEPRIYNIHTTNNIIQLMFDYMFDYYNARMYSPRFPDRDACCAGPVFGAVVCATWGGCVCSLRHEINHCSEIALKTMGDLPEMRAFYNKQ